MKPNKDSALIVTDVQIDFCPGGALQVKDGDKIIPVLNKYIEIFEKEGLPVYYTRDWHPSNHCSFIGNGGIWPLHCLQGSKGAEFHPELKITSNACMIYKATNPEKEAYSTFEHTDLHENLKKQKIHMLYIGGLATDYCIKNSVIDACHLGYKVFVLMDGIKGVEVNPGESARALRMMKDVGSTFLQLNSLAEPAASSIES